MHVRQTVISCTASQRGSEIITNAIEKGLASLGGTHGLLHCFIQHTSASLTINENADPDVPADLTMSLDHIVPEDLPFCHTAEGPDDMPAHVKSSLMGGSVTIPVQDGRLCLGVWQGVYLNEHRDRPTPRKIMLTFIGE